MNTLITGAFPLSEEERQQLEADGLRITHHPDERTEVPHPDEYEAVIGNAVFLYTPAERFTRLQYVQLTSAGLDRVPMAYMNAHGITVCAARGVYSVPMAEFAVGGVLQIYKQTASFYENQKAHRWEKHRHLQELAGKTVCVVGCGNVGEECARRFAAFDCHVRGIDLSPRSSAAFEQIWPLERLDEALCNSDIVVLTLPLTPQTAGLFDAARLRRLKAGAVLVNIARGGIVPTEALVQALHDHLGGAVLDVFEEEPLPAEHPLWDLPQVVLSPHNSFVGEGNHARLFALTRRNIQRFLTEERRT